MKRIDFVSLFSGAGGLDLGLAKAGFRCVYASDFDPVAVKTLEQNQNSKSKLKGQFADAVIELADVAKISGQQILDRVNKRRGDIPLLAGGPPCQSWSSAGHQLGFDDPRGQLWSDFARVACELDVRWLIFENVRGLLTARGEDGVPGSALRTIREKLLEFGFQTTVSLLNAADFGVPQRRVRLFIIGFRAGDTPAFPEPTHSKDDSNTLRKWVPLKNVLLRAKQLREGEIIYPTGKMAIELKDIKPGSGVKSQGKKERTRPGGHWGYKQGAFVADPNLPSRTITAGGQQDWIRDPDLGLRRLSPRECAAIQTFPKNYVFVGTKSQQYRQIGNAVPPKLAAAIGGQLYELISECRRKDLGTDQNDLLPLPPKLESAIAYTKREEASNGASRRAAPNRRRSRISLAV